MQIARHQSALRSIPKTNVLSWSCAVPSLTLCCQYDAVGIEGSVSTDLHGWQVCVRSRGDVVGRLVPYYIFLFSKYLGKMDIQNHIIGIVVS